MKVSRRHKPSMIWPTHRLPSPGDEADYQQKPHGYVRTTSDGKIEIDWFTVLPGECGGTLVMSRRNARLLMRRIAQCLEAT